MVDNKREATTKMTDKTPLGVVLSLLTSFRVLERYLEVELVNYGVSLSSFLVMSALYRNGGVMTPSEIGESVFRANNSITAVINTLERQGVARREPSQDDRRSVKVIITDKGWTEANQLSPIVQERSREVLSYLDKDQIEELVVIMRKIRESLLPRITKTSGR